MNLARVEKIFHQCLALPESERQAFLERACDGDEDLVREVRTLLEHSEVDATLGDEAIIKRNTTAGSVEGAQGAASSGPDPTTLVGQRIGNYEVERVIASGGMGTVLAAIQPGPDRRVALKLLRPELLGPALIQRFSLEVQVMGKLHHPNIAQVYDGGSETLLGVHVPFFAMEFVPNAVPIHEYANGTRVREFEARPTAERLDIDATLGLFSQLCEAISHAHLRGVIHRDLKPDNVLVDSHSERPHPKVIDFGIARLSEEGSGATGLTSAGQILGTLETMSPEQARGAADEIDVRTDIYSLGVILHQMLTGHAPLAVRGESVPEAIRIILEDLPRPASEQRSGVRPEIDAIILKSLSKESDQRYESVRAFQEDIHAFLEGRTVTARAPSTLQLLRMNARRHRAVLIPVAIVFAVAVVAAIISTRFAFQASQRAVEARQSAEEADRRTADANRLAYRASLGAAASALEEAEILAARQYLEEVPQSERGWEWRHLLSRLQDTGREFNTGRSYTRGYSMGPDGKAVVAVAADSALLVWDRNPLYADFDPQGRYVVVGTDAPRVCVWDLDAPNDAPLYTVDLYENPRGVQISDDGQVLAVATEEPKLYAFDLGNGEPLGTFGGLAGSFSPLFRPGTRELFAHPQEQDQPIMI